MTILEVLQYNPTVMLTIAAIFGLMIGSFLNVVIYRYPIMLFRDWGEMAKEVLTEQGYKVSGSATDARISDKKFNLVTPRSRCPHCGHLIRSWENIPVLSYLWQRGRCSACKTRISFRYPFIEMLTGVSFAYVASVFGLTIEAAIYSLVTALFIVHIFVDIDHKILPDPLNYIILWVGLAAAAAGLTIPLVDAVLGALIGYLSLWSFYWIFKILTKKEGMGYGDFKLLAAIGALVGYQKLLLVIILSAGVGAILGISLMAMKIADRESQIPFGPYLAIAGWIAIFWGDSIMQQYFSFVGL